jgi:hypothetical protein
MSVLNEAIRIGEDAVTRAIAMVNRERKLNWWLHRIRHLITTGRPQKAVEMADKAIEMIEGEMAVGPPVSWVHELHQVTGLFALRGNRMSDGEREKVRDILANVLREMEDDTNWLQLPARSGPRSDSR